MTKLSNRLSWGGAVMAAVGLLTSLQGCGPCSSGWLIPSDESYVEGCGCVANPDKNHCHERGGSGNPGYGGYPDYGYDAAPTGPRVGDAAARDASDADAGADADADAGDANANPDAADDAAP